MPDITIYVASMNAPPENEEGISLYGSARCTGMDDTDEDIAWTVLVDHGALTTTINSAIREAAIAAADLRGYTVGALDKKTLIGAAVGL